MLSRTRYPASRSLSTLSNTPFVTVQRWKSSSVGSAQITPEEISGETKKHPELKHIPKLPILGSLFAPYSKMKQTANLYDLYHTNNKKYGNFYSLGLPFLNPKDIYGTVHVLRDPHEMMKVLRLEGPHPRGAVENQWSIKSFLSDVGSPLHSGLFANGEQWKRQRAFLQTDMLCPKAARGYLPGIIAAAEIASEAAPEYSDNFTEFATYCAFDMFSSFMFGELTKSVLSKKDDSLISKENLEFVTNGCGALQNGLMMTRTFSEIFMNKMGIKSEKYYEFSKQAGTVRKIGFAKIDRFLDRKAANELSENEKASYLNRALTREEDSDLSRSEVLELCNSALWAAVDTTSSVFNLNLLHLALNPHVQEKLYDEIATVTVGTGGKLTADLISKSVTPYLYAFVRETHRITPAAPAILTKSNTTDEVEVHGKVFPRNSVFVLDFYTAGMDENIVDNPHEFRPERFLQEEVSNRAKNTDASFIDNTLYKEPFGQGVRRCPGSRIASNEILTLLAQLVKDWKITVKDPSIKSYKDVKIEIAVLMLPHMPELEFTRR